MVEHHTRSMSYTYSKELAEGYVKKTGTRICTENFDHVEAPNVSRMLGDIKGLRVLDLGCGSGRFTRWIKTSKCAEEVVGIRPPEIAGTWARVPRHKSDLAGPFE